MLPIRDVNPTAIRPLVTWAIIALNVLVFLVVQPQEEAEAEEFAYHYSAIACEITTGEPLDAREITTGACRDGPGLAVFPDKSIPASVVFSLFLHGGLAHLGFNMWSLWIFGNNVEEGFGHLAYLIMYLVAGAAAAFGFVLVNPELTVPLVGASGAIAGVMGSYLVLFPRHHVMTLVFFRIVAIPAVAFLGIWFASQFVLTDGNVAWEAHVAGFLLGVLATLPFRRRLLGNTLAGERDLARTY